jgi:hypothetical protein
VAVWFRGRCHGTVGTVAVAAAGYLKLTSAASAASVVFISVIAAEGAGVAIAQDDAVGARRQAVVVRPSVTTVVTVVRGFCGARRVADDTGAEGERRAAAGGSRAR